MPDLPRHSKDDWIIAFVTELLRESGRKKLSAQAANAFALLTWAQEGCADPVDAARRLRQASQPVR